VINGTCSGRTFKLGLAGEMRCGDFNVRMK